MPDGAPDWVTAKLIDETIDAWSDDYAGKLTAEDALEILLLFDGLFDVLEDLDG